MFDKKKFARIVDEEVLLHHHYLTFFCFRRWCSKKPAMFHGHGYLSFSTIDVEKMQELNGNVQIFFSFELILDESISFLSN